MICRRHSLALSNSFEAVKFVGKGDPPYGTSEVLRRKTCLLLGAGASHHLGFPLGEELKTGMLDSLWGQLQPNPPASLSFLNQWHSSLQLFHDRLAFGNWASPDAFLEKHAEHMNAGKALICHLLAQREDIQRVAHGNGWYRHLVKSIHVDDARHFKGNSLSIVTFNYDRSLDFALHM